MNPLNTDVKKNDDYTKRVRAAVASKSILQSKKIPM